MSTSDKTDRAGMDKSSFVFASLLLLTACNPVKRKIASTGLPPEVSNLKEASEQILADVEDEEFKTLCVPYLRKLEKNIDGIDVRKLAKDEVSRDAEEIAKTSWKIRTSLHSKLAAVDKDCAIQMQATFRQFRFIEDYLLEISRKVDHKNPSDIDFQKGPIPMKDPESFYEASLNGTDKFRDGDMLITRGVSFLSGMIARLGKNATQFSHIVWVHEEPKTKEIKTIESYVGVGVAFYEMDYALKNENARILWLRAKDKDLAVSASQKIATLVRERIEAKNPIKYDYELNFEDPNTMSCAEVSQVAFQLASENKFRIPFYPNTIIGAKSLIQRLKLVEGETYEPGDMEIDPRFELVGEFRDLRLTRDSRQKDAIMTAMFDWMENKNYYLQDNFKSRMAGGPIWLARKTFLWPLVKKTLKITDFSKELPRNMLTTVTLVNEVGALLLEELKARDKQFEEQYGVPMSYMDFYKALEEMRVNDLEFYKNKKTRKQAKIHQLLRPKD